MDAIHTIYTMLIHDIENLRPLEIAGVFFGLVSVLYERKGNVLLYPTGLINVVIYIYLCFIAKLYGDMAINIYYFIVSIYGWYFWLHKNKKGNYVAISFCTRKELVNFFILLIVSFIVLYILLRFFTDSNVPMIDSFTTSLFFTGMLLLARKKIENWYMWIIGDFISIPLYFYKGLALTSLQFLVFFILAISGYFVWKKLYNTQPI